MAEQEEEESKVGIGRKIVWGLIFFAATSAYYQFLDWSLMIHAQNLPYPYK